MRLQLPILFNMFISVYSREECRGFTNRVLASAVSLYAFTVLTRELCSLSADPSSLVLR